MRFLKQDIEGALEAQKPILWAIWIYLVANTACPSFLSYANGNDGGGCQVIVWHETKDGAESVACFTINNNPFPTATQ